MASRARLVVVAPLLGLYFTSRAQGFITWCGGGVPVAHRRMGFTFRAELDGSPHSPFGASPEQQQSTAGPPRPLDRFNTELSDQELQAAKEQYAAARARREKFLMEAQKKLQMMTQEHEAEMDRLLNEEEMAAKELELRGAIMKQVKDEVGLLVREAEEASGGLKGWMRGFNVVHAVSVLLVLDTAYVSYLTYEHSERLASSVGTELILAAFLFWKVREQARIEADLGANKKGRQAASLDK